VVCQKPATVVLDIDISICKECYDREENMTHPPQLNQTKHTEMQDQLIDVDIPAGATCAYLPCENPATIASDIDTFICNDCYRNEQIVEVQNLPFFGSGLFESVRTGDQGDGLIVYDVGYAWIHLIESLGIESTIGTSGFRNPEHYKKWAESALSSPLNDWEPIEIVLFESWMPCLHDQFPTGYYHCSTAFSRHKYEGEFCYMVWGTRPDPDAIFNTARTVYSLRHTAFYSKASKTSQTEYGLDYFYKARQQSFDLLKINS
tara:strand:- start:122 stop:904 length:783 start_codon:yes stop_codon:yes gene_type:complete